MILIQFSRKIKRQYSNKIIIFAKDSPLWPAVFYFGFSLSPTRCPTSKLAGYSICFFRSFPEFLSVKLLLLSFYERD